ncbi:MAG: ImmA/IrrE family metallo-endopeptidase [Methanoregula sp.]|jgi:Zn-dependent peptidase ImmA (M78 family)|nr:ImmA/IrrE family metallo-endopeptidase [Methanoregula sp.]
MSRSAPNVVIAPDVFRWLCGSSGFTPSDISKKIGVSERVVQSWCEGTHKPVVPLTKVEHLADMFKRPLAAFLLANPPEEPQLPKDFRRHHGAEPGYSKELLLVIRKARRIQEIHHELTENLHISSQVPLKIRTIKDDPEKAAQEERERSGLLIYGDTPGMTPVKAFEIWRGWLESQNISVLKTTMPAGDARGFSLTDGELYVIVVNSADADRARLFTLFHEYAHILLNIPVICNQGEDDLKEYAPIERWCNHFAGAFLAPREDIENNAGVRQALASGNYLRAAGSIRKQFLISDEAGLMRLLTLKQISSSQFIQGREKLREDFALREAKKKQVTGQAGDEEKGGFGIRLDKNCVAEKGAGYVSLVMENVRKGHISSSDALDYLDVKLRHLEKFQESTGV